MQAAVYPVPASDWLTAEVSRLTAEWHPGAAGFTRALAAAAPTITVARCIMAGLGVKDSTAASRLARAGLPSPKTQLQLFRLTLSLELAHASQAPIVAVSNALEYASAQSFGRHIRTQLGMTASDFFSRWTRDGFWSAVVAPVMLWSDDRWLTVDVLEGSRVRYRVQDGAA